MTRAHRKRPVRERFDEKWVEGPPPAVDPSLGPCHLWTASVNNRGYPRFSYNGKNDYAHRVAWILDNGPIPDDQEIDHRCGVKLCVRGTHVRPATGKQNAENVGPRSHNKTTGIRGVKRQGNRFLGRVTHNKVTYYTKTYDTIEEAEVAVKELRRKLFTHSQMDEAAQVKTNHVLVVKPHHFNPATDDPEEEDWEWDAWITCLDPNRQFCDLWLGPCTDCQKAGTTGLDVDNAPRDRFGFPMLHGMRHGYDEYRRPIYSWKCMSEADDVMEYVMNELASEMGEGRWYVAITRHEGRMVINIHDTVPGGEEPKAT